MLEKNLQKKIVKYLRELPRSSHARVVHGGPHGTGGEPDIDAVIEGVSLKIEVKVPGNSPTPRQLSVIRKWRESGAIAGWANCIDHVVQLLTLVDLVRAGTALEWQDDGSAPGWAGWADSDHP